MSSILTCAVVSLFPGMFDAISAYGITRRVLNRGLAELSIFNPRDYTVSSHNQVDDHPYGGGPGMVMQVAPLQQAVCAAREAISKKKVGQPPKVIYLSPKGQLFDHQQAQRLASAKTPLILVAGRYEGVDQRFIELEVDEQWSIGNYVLTGGELPIMVVLDAMMRLLPGALGDPESIQVESFQDALLDHPQYTRPEIFSGLRVPRVLLSGDHAKIAAWRAQARQEWTELNRPDLLQPRKIDEA